MSVDYQKVADVLETVAAYVDGIEHQKIADEQSKRTQRVKKLATSYEASTGESLPSDMEEKLAKLDQETLDHLLKVANNTGDSPDSLGHPANMTDHTAPKTTKEAAVRAEERFLDWIVS